MVRDNATGYKGLKPQTKPIDANQILPKLCSQGKLYFTVEQNAKTKAPLHAVQKEDGGNSKWLTWSHS